jgi:hypothetical protein
MGVRGWGAAKDVIRWEIEAGSLALWNVGTLERWERRKEMEPERAGGTGGRGWNSVYTTENSMGVARG